jgi:hypothetical protein
LEGNDEQVLWGSECREIKWFELVNFKGFKLL